MTAVKVCGLTRLEDVRAARGADFLGLVIATGTRRSLDPPTARRLAAASPLPTVAVTTSSDEVFIERTVKEVGPDAVQLQAGVNRDLVHEIRERVDCEVWVAVHVGPCMKGLDRETLSLVDCVVLDTASPQGGGTGEVHDHAISARLRRELGPLRCALAGGLTPENVRKAISAVRPDIVDVSSGVETEGVKDPLKIERFIDAVRTC